LFKTIPVKKQGKYNLNVQLQDLGIKLVILLGWCLTSEELVGVTHWRR
jgi:hypothetical protein